MKRFISLALSLALILSVVPAAMAAEAGTLPEQGSTTSEIGAARASSRPTSSHSLPYTATITNLQKDHTTYTRYYFSPSGEDIGIYGTFYPVDADGSSTYRGKVYLYEVGTNECIDSFTTDYFSDGGLVDKVFRNLDTKSSYYLAIVNVSSKSDQYIWGEIYIV